MALPRVISVRSSTSEIDSTHARFAIRGATDHKGPISRDDGGPPPDKFTEIRREMKLTESEPMYTKRP